MIPTGLLDLAPLTRNTTLVPYDFEAHSWRERTHDSQIAAKTQAARFRDSMCLRAGVDDDERNQPDFEITLEMWERASWDEYEIPTLSRTRDRRIEVWTDGSAKEKESPWAHAGAGATWGSDYLPEISFAITRRDAQSNDRAELEALLCAMLSTDPPVAVMTDNEWVSKAANLLLDARNNDGEVRLSQFHNSHREVWIEIRKRILERPTGWITIRHVYEHATTTDVCSGRIARKDAEMNQRADRLADKGADLGAPSRLALTRFQDNAKLVVAVQRMAVRLVDARDHLEEIAPEARNSNMEAGAVQDLQSKQWYRPMLRHQMSDGRIKMQKNTDPDPAGATH